MKKGMIQVLCGEGSGKSACAIGLAVKAAGRNQNIVNIIKSPEIARFQDFSALMRFKSTLSQLLPGVM